MFPTMNTRILNIRASQPNGKINFTGAFSGYHSAHQTSLELTVEDQELFTNKKTRTVYHLQAESEAETEIR